MHWMDWFGGGWIMMAFWWIVAIGVIFLIARAIGVQKPLETAQDSALEILKKRYARGEISDEEFESKKSDII